MAMPIAAASRAFSDSPPGHSKHLATIALQHPGDDLHERRLSGAILAHEEVYFSRANREIPVTQRCHSAEVLLNIL